MKFESDLKCNKVYKYAYKHTQTQGTCSHDIPVEGVVLQTEALQV